MNANLIKGFGIAAGIDTYTVSFANTGNSTLNIDSLGAIPIKNTDGSALIAGNITAGSIHTLMYDETNLILI